MRAQACYTENSNTTTGFEFLFRILREIYPICMKTFSLPLLCLRAPNFIHSSNSSNWTINPE